MPKEESPMQLRLVPLSAIHANPYQPRQGMLEEELEELAASIRQHGVIQPPVVRILPGSPPEYQLIAGERRFRAAQRVGLAEIPVLVQQSDVTDSAQMALAENVQRVDLNPLELAQALKRLAEDFGYSQKELAQLLGKKRSTVANYLRLLTLPASVQKALRQGSLTLGHAKVVLSLESEGLRQTLSRKIQERQLSVREAEEEARSLRGKKERREETSPRKGAVHQQAMERQLTEHFGLRVKLQSQSPHKGVIQIAYDSLEDFDHFLTQIHWKEESIDCS